jgi:hypothetical protein
MAQYFLSDADLAQMRADVDRMLPDDIEILVPVRVADSAGRGSITHQSRGTIKGRVGPLRSRTIQPGITGGREGLLNLFTLTVSYSSTLLKLNHRVRHVASNLTYEIRGLIDDHSWNVSKQAYILRVD